MHPELVRIENLVRRLEAEMGDAETDEVDKSLFPLASEYAELCRRANDRLETCVGIINAGEDKEYQALMAATRSPDLLDLCAILGELEADKYREYCRENHLPVADAINESAKQIIDPIYSRAGNFQKTLMSEYSAANSKRDFHEALRVIRQVAALNPEDVNSVQQAANLEDRLVAETIRKLEPSLRENNTSEILKFLEELENIAPGRTPKSDDTRESPWRDALELREDFEREQAIESSESLLADALAARKANKLNDVLTLVGMVTELTKRHDFTLKPNQREIHADLEEWSSSELRKWKEEENHKERLEKLELSVRSIRDKDFQRVKPGLAELQEDALSIRRLWKDISEARKPVPESIQEDARKVLVDLEEKISVKQRAQRRNLISLVAGGSLILLVLVSFAFFFWKAGQKADQLERALAENRASDLERNIKQLEAEKPVWKNFGALPSAVEKAQSWLNLEEANANQVNTIIQNLTNDFNAVPNPAEWTEISLSSIRSKLEQAREQAKEVNPDFQSDMAGRLSELERKYDQIAEAKRNTIAPDFHAQVLELDRLIRAALSSEQGSSEVLSASTEAGILISRMEAAAKTELEDLKPFAADLTTFDILKEKYTSLEADVILSRKLKTGLENAASLETYVDALTNLENSNLVAGTEKIAIGNIIRKIHSENAILREILMPGDLVRWSLLNEGKYNTRGFPSEVTGPEKPLFLGLRDDASLTSIHRYDVNEPGETRLVFSRNNPLEFRNSKIGEITQIEVTGAEVYDPAKSGTRSATFTPGKYRARISNTGTLGFAPRDGGISRESTFFKTLRLDGYVDPSISKFRDSLLTAVEVIYASDESISPLFKAYVQIRINELMQHRRTEWLLDFTTHDQDHKELLSLTGNGSLKSDSWMVPDDISRYAQSLAGFYARKKGTKMAKQAEAAHLFFKSMQVSGIGHAGYVDGEKNTHVLTEPGDSDTLWALTPALEFRPVLQRNNTEWEAINDFVSYSPLFHFRRTPESALEEAAKSALLEPDDESFLREIPAIFRPGTL